LPTNPAGVSAVANLAGNELSITVNTNNSVVAGELKPKVSVRAATGEVYSFVLTVNVQGVVPVDNTPPSKVSEDLVNGGIDTAGYTGVGSITFNEPIASVSDVKFVDAVTGVTLTGGASSAKVSVANAMVVDVEFTIGIFWIGILHGIKLCFTAVDLASNSVPICSNKYDVN